MNGSTINASNRPLSSDGAQVVDGQGWRGWWQQPPRCRCGDTGEAIVEAMNEGAEGVTGNVEKDENDTGDTSTTLESEAKVVVDEGFEVVHWDGASEEWCD